MKELVDGVPNDFTELAFHNRSHASKIQAAYQKLKENISKATKVCKPLVLTGHWTQPKHRKTPDYRYVGQGESPEEGTDVHYFNIFDETEPSSEAESEVFETPEESFDKQPPTCKTPEKEIEQDSGNSSACECIRESPAVLVLDRDGSFLIGTGILDALRIPTWFVELANAASHGKRVDVVELELAYRRLFSLL